MLFKIAVVIDIASIRNLDDATDVLLTCASVRVLLSLVLNEHHALIAGSGNVPFSAASCSWVR